MKNKKIAKSLSKQQKEKLDKWLATTKKIMNMSHWDISFQYTKEVDGNMFLQAKTQSDYLRLIIVVYEEAVTESWDKDGDDFVEGGIYHEMVHALHSEFRDVALKRFINQQQIYDAEERMTEQLARIIFSLKNK